MLPVRTQSKNTIKMLAIQNPRAILRAKTSKILGLGAKLIAFCAQFLQRNAKCKHNQQPKEYRSSKRAIFCAKTLKFLVLVANRVNFCAYFFVREEMQRQQTTLLNYCCRSPTHAKELNHLKLIHTAGKPPLPHKTGLFRRFFVFSSPQMGAIFARVSVTRL